MTKKDYELMAAQFRNYLLPTEKRIHTKDVEQALYVIALKLCKVFEADNPRFDTDKFLDACGFNED